MPHQTTDHLVLIRPRAFAVGSPTHLDNKFMTAAPPERQAEIAAAARAEFEHYVDTLRRAGLRLTILDDRADVHTPDSVFPNNWFTTHADGTFVTYLLAYDSRRLERRPDLLELLVRDHRIDRVLAFEDWEREQRYLEGTGVLVLDRVRKIAYVCLSARATRSAIHDWCAALGYRPLTFRAVGASGLPIYHTNVMLSIGTKAAIVCLDAVLDPAEKSKLTESLALTGKRIVGISQAQLDDFAGNALEVRTPAGPAWVMSSRAYESLDPAQLEALGAPVIHAPLPTLETYGGGSARCMIAEVFLPLRS